MTRRILAFVLLLAMIGMGWPASLQAAPARKQVQAQGQSGEIRGKVQDAYGRPLVNHTCRLRHYESGQLVTRGTGKLLMTVTTNSNGEFVFDRLSPGRYVVEATDSSNNFVGMSAAITLTARDLRVANVLITPSSDKAAAGMIAGGASKGGSFFTSKLGIILLAASGAGITAGVIAANDSASGSR